MGDYQESEYNELEVFDDEKKLNQNIKSFSDIFKDYKSGQIRSKNVNTVMNDIVANTFSKLPFAKDSEDKDDDGYSKLDAYDTLQDRKDNPVLAEGTLERYSTRKSKDVADDMIASGKVLKFSKDNCKSDADFAVKESTQTYPVRTGQAIADFSDTMKDKISDAYDSSSSEYKDAMNGLNTVTSHMTDVYYDQLMDMEKSGRRLTLEEKKQIDDLKIDGVNVKYSEYDSSKDITKEYSDFDKNAMSVKHTNEIDEATDKMTEDEIRKSRKVESKRDNLFYDKSYEIKNPSVSLKSSDGTFYSNGFDEQLVTDAKTDARLDAEADRFRDKNPIGSPKNSEDTTDEIVNEKTDSVSNDITKLRSDRAKTLSEKGEDGVETANKEMSEGYMKTFAGIQAYNDEAVSAIDKQFANNAAGRQNAINGLSRVVGSMTNEAFDNLKQDNDGMNFLSDEDKEKLDSLQLTGVNVKFSEYERGMNVRTAESNKNKETEAETAGVQADLDEYGAEYTDEEEAMLGEFANADRGNTISYGTPTTTQSKKIKHTVLTPIPEKPKYDPFEADMDY